MAARGPRCSPSRSSSGWPGVLVEQHGIRSIRLTGGEPTVRAHLPVLVAKLAALPVDLALTTNGATLASVAAGLAEAGLRRVNVSLDSLRPSASPSSPGATSSTTCSPASTPPSRPGSRP